MGIQQVNICRRFLNYPKKTKKTSVQIYHVLQPNLFIQQVLHVNMYLYTDEAAKEARTKLFSMWYSFGPPSVLFTISPGDKCSFPIKLYVNLKMDFLPQPTEDDDALIFDSLFRSKIRIDNPGACAREYNAIMQIIMEALIGWDFKEQKQVFFWYFWRGIWME
jgi:hypothetical protein